MIQSLLDYVKDQIDMVDDDFDSQIKAQIINGLNDIVIATNWSQLITGSIFNNDDKMTIVNYENLNQNSLYRLQSIMDYCVLKVSVWEDRYDKTMTPFYKEEMNNELTKFRFIAQKNSLNDYLQIEGDK